MQAYHQFIVTAAQSGVSSTQLSAPPQIALNKHNISQVKRAILDVYHYHTPGSLYEQIKKSPFGGLMHDGISKFCNEFNGVYLRGIDEQNHPFDVPYCLTKLKGAADSFDLDENFHFVSFSKLAYFFMLSQASTNPLE